MLRGLRLSTVIRVGGTVRRATGAALAGVVAMLCAVVSSSRTPTGKMSVDPSIPFPDLAELKRRLLEISDLNYA